MEYKQLSDDQKKKLYNVNRIDDNVIAKIYILII